MILNSIKIFDRVHDMAILYFSLSVPSTSAHFYFFLLLLCLSPYRKAHDMVTVIDFLPKHTGGGSAKQESDFL
jgi:hypothetical protein